MKPEVQEFFDSLTEKDIVKLQAAIHTYHIIQTAGWIIRWGVISALAIAVSIAQFGDSFVKIKEWLK